LVTQSSNSRMLLSESPFMIACFGYSVTALGR